MATLTTTPNQPGASTPTPEPALAPPPVSPVAQAPTPKVDTAVNKLLQPVIKPAGVVIPQPGTATQPVKATAPTQPVAPVAPAPATVDQGTVVQMPTNAADVPKPDPLDAIGKGGLTQRELNAGYYIGRDGKKHQSAESGRKQLEAYTKSIKSGTNAAQKAIDDEKAKTDMTNWAASMARNAADESAAQAIAQGMNPAMAAALGAQRTQSGYLDAVKTKRDEMLERARMLSQEKIAKNELKQRQREAQQAQDNAFWNAIIGGGAGVLGAGLSAIK